MQPAKIISSGGIIFRKSSNIVEYLVLKQQLASGEVQFVSAKGRVERDEQLLATALREVQEECGINASKLKNHGFIGKEEYMHGNSPKEVNWYHFELVQDSEIKLCEEEGFVDYYWLPYKDAKDLFSHSEFKKLLEKTNESLS